jgi:hypothetical protein
MSEDLKKLKNCKYMIQNIIDTIYVNIRLPNQFLKKIKIKNNCSSYLKKI